MLREILSDENIALHKEYVRQMRLKLSIIESYIPTIRNMSVRDVLSLRLDKRDRRDILALLPEISIHDLYFSSFTGNKNIPSEAVRKRFGSESAFLNTLYREALEMHYGFLAIFENGSFSKVSDYPSVYTRSAPVLAIDLCEHAYFLDYGFDRERYIISCLTYLDLGKIKLKNSEV
jgi:Fe-Mn family superoxide dismutase